MSIRFNDQTIAVTRFVDAICLLQMWACALGHVEAALLLYKWDRRALAIPDSLGRLPLAIARSRGHTRLAECLEHLQRDEHQQQQSTSPSLPFSPGTEAAHADSWVDMWGGEALSGGLRAMANTSSSSQGEQKAIGRKENMIYKECSCKQIDIFMALHQFQVDTITP